ncbi:GNAT family N-acetyltransferase [Dysgonomonas sp. ZJ709]|uniref:GNAT family N-acetyltransferase n=1 Tax=Dysgonomonas sp. ZJ709 TaxID=2709797 RepID=UPI0013EE02A5|nr:GNAT family protein [Dysgonomonas sp. ZJ709]
MIRLQNIAKASSEDIQRLANNHAIAINLRDAFPHPYTIEDSVTFLELATNGMLGKVYGIYDGDTFVGCCSLIPQQDVYRINAEIGYWIGEPYWGKGFATEAVKLLLNVAFNKLGLLRVYAYIFEYNSASMRVLEKSGFKKEAIIKSSIIKEGKIFDEHLYSIRKDEEDR